MMQSTVLNSRSRAVKKCDNPPLSNQRVPNFRSMLNWMFTIKKELKLSNEGLFLFVVILGCVERGYDLTVTRLSVALYESSTKKRSLRYRLATMVRNGNLIHEGNKYYLTDKAIEAINKIAL
jgi:hypothetical protein